jgi:hypothetical protein
MRRTASSVIPRIPQWVSEKWLEKSRLRSHVVTGVVRYWRRGGIDRGSIEPLYLDPIK